MASHREEIKREILSTFNKNVKGKIPDLSTYNRSHDGAEGDWLTISMGLTVNGKNEPDFKGFEMKKDSKKTTHMSTPVFHSPSFHLYTSFTRLYNIVFQFTRSSSCFYFLFVFGKQAEKGPQLVFHLDANICLEAQILLSK